MLSRSGVANPRHHYPFPPTLFARHSIPQYRTDETPPTSHPFSMKPQFLLLLALLALSSTLRAQDTNFIKSNDVTWNELGADENSSMPLGNGDIALNVWTEKNGDIVLLLAKADAWSENGQMMKLGRVRVKLTPNPFAGSDPFQQTLTLETGEIVLSSGKNTARIWVDANQPVVRVQFACEKPVSVEAHSEIWRKQPYHLNSRAVGAAGFFEMGGKPDGLSFDADTILPAHDNAISWCHFNTTSIYPLVFQREHLDVLLPKYPDPVVRQPSRHEPHTIRQTRTWRPVRRRHISARDRARLRFGVPASRGHRHEAGTREQGQGPEAGNAEGVAGAIGRAVG